MLDYLDEGIDIGDPRIASVFDETAFWAAHFGRLMLAHIPLHPDLRVLDLATGLGFPLFELAHMLGPSARLVGVDIWSGALQRARQKLGIYQLPNASLIEANGERLPLSSAAFDMVTSNCGINNFEDPARILAEAYRVLRPGGRIILTTNTIGHMRSFYALFEQVLQDMGYAEVLPALKAQEDHRMNEEIIQGYLEDAGFVVKEAIHSQFTLRYLDGSAFFRNWLIRVGFLTSWRRVVEGLDERAIFTELEARLNKRTAAMGDLAMQIPMLYIEGEK